MAKDEDAPQICNEHPQGEWTLRMFGDVQLLDSSGRRVALPNRKVEGILAVLALHRQYGIERDRAAEILWPGKPLENQRTNLRQVLMLLRKVLGEGALDDSRTHCRLSTSFRLATNYPRANGAGFMPGHEGDWFEQIRAEVLDAEPEAGVLFHLLETFRWYAVHDPVGMFALLRTTPGLNRGIEFRDMLDLLNTAGLSPETAGWSTYWRGTAEDDLQLCAGLLRTALREAKRTQDLELASEACLELGKVYARTGRFVRAEKICKIANAVAGECRSRSSRVNATRLNGIVLTHWGRHEEGLRLLGRSEDLIQNPVDRALALGVRAFIEASVGQFEKARTTLESRSNEALKLGHTGADKVGAMTEAMLTAAGERRRAIPDLERLSDRCHAVGATQFGVYADELLARLFLLEGDRGLADRRLQAARQGRLSSQMSVTPLEAQRVAALG